MLNSLSVLSPALLVTDYAGASQQHHGITLTSLASLHAKTRDLGTM